MKMISTNKLLSYIKIVWIYTKYQFLTKVLLFLIIFPIFRIILKKLIETTGRVSISSGDYIKFLFSINGIVLLITSLAILILLIGIDINSFIIISSLIEENKIELNAKKILIIGIKSLKLFLRPVGLLITLYISFIVPIVGIGLNVSIMKNFKIPNFITDVIFNNNLYFTIYFIVIIILLIITVLYIFFFHFLIIDNQSIESSLKKSSYLVKKYFKEFIKEFFIKIALIYLIIISMITLLVYFLLRYIQIIENIFLKRFLSIFISITITELFLYVSIMSVPFICYSLTKLFYKLNKKEGYEIKLKIDFKTHKLSDYTSKKMRIRDKFVLIIVFLIFNIFNLSISIFSTIFFDDLFKVNRNIEIIAHRGGGDLAAENSILGMEKAIKNGAKWSEIDVQRTKDGHYIINHDSTFKRVANTNKRSIDLRLDEIKKLKIKDLFNENGIAQPIPTLDEYLDAAKGKMGLFIELKGITADEKMVDDIIKMVKEKNMEKEIVILSLDYSLINYVEDNYPEIDTGYLYFFSIGSIESLRGDMLIMEEQEATEDKVRKIKLSGKKAIVWTINKDESIDKFILSNVDGIITDYVRKVRDKMEKTKERSEIEIIIDTIMK